LINSSAVLVDQASDDLPPLGPGSGERDDIRVVEGSELISALVRPVSVEVGLVSAKEFLGVAAVVDQEPVGALLSYGAHEPLRVGIAVRSDNTCANCKNGFPSNCLHRQFMSTCQAEYVRMVSARRWYWSTCTSRERVSARAGRRYLAQQQDRCTCDPLADRV
jgi:hypothetical protein